MDITELPFNRLVGITRSSEGGAVLGLPADPKYSNHLGTVHASALLALAEASSGEGLLAELADIGFPVLPVVRRIEAKFRNPATGAVHSKMGPRDPSLTECRTLLASRGRAHITVAVDIFDQTGAHALAARVEWFVARR